VDVYTEGRSQEIEWLSQRYEELVANVRTVVHGKDAVIRLAVTCMLAEGHLLIEDVPGVAKTTLAKALAASVDGTMRRIQFTPDLLPSDVTGVQIYDSGRREWEFHEGPVFANIVLGDEINRASPKTQAALLEVMEERQVTVDSVPYAVPRPFIVIATQNPVEQGGTYELPEAQIDRFMVKMSIGYPSHEAEIHMLERRTRGQDSEKITPVMTTADLSDMIEIVRGVHLAPAVLSYIVTLVAATRRLPEVRLGVSPRGSIALAQAAQARAATSGRDFVSVDDVKVLAPYVLGHRLLLRPEAELQQVTTVRLVESTLAAVPVPLERAAL
jgi:MoxR-like ATPase